jgi:tRNA threonylcarbamoyl adenosine modification protein YeaZ
MKILILETSGEKGCLVLSENEKPLAVQLLPGGPELSKSLASEVAKLKCKAAIQNPKNEAFSGAPNSKCKAAIQNPKNEAFSGAPNSKCKAALHLDLIAVGTGPGSYTGIRVGTALAKALAYGWEVPLIGFCSLKAFSRDLPVLVDARMGGFYALIDQKPALLPPDHPSLQTLSQIASPHPELIKKRLTTSATWHQTDPNPDLLAQLVYRQFLNEGISPLELTYLSCP